METYIPTMHINLPQVTDPREKILYILRHFTSIPTNASVTYKDEMISLQYIAATVSYEPNRVAELATSALNTVYKKILPEYSVTVEISPVTIDDVRYNLEIDITAIKGSEILSIAGRVVITEDHQISFSYKQGQ